MSKELPHLTETHREIVIRYAYDIVTDDHVAHFELPVVPPGFQNKVRVGLRSAAGPRSVRRKGAEEVLLAAKHEIDSYLDY